MRLPLLPPRSLSAEQRALYDDIMSVVNHSFGSFVAMRQDGTLIGPFNSMLHFPAFGRAAWAFNKTMYEHTTLPNSILQVAVLVTATRVGARYQIYGHEHLAESAGLARAKIATIVAGERPVDLTRQEAVAYDVATALNWCAPLPETIYQAGVDAFGERGMAEIIYLVACFHMVGIVLNGYAVPVPGEDDADESRAAMMQAAPVKQKGDPA
ncbi:MAG TPA: carboxymuconolactone decarboxylase family protein [Xanthobacteraceae bacterium]